MLSLDFDQLNVLRILFSWTLKPFATLESDFSFFSRQRFFDVVNSERFSFWQVYEKHPSTLHCEKQFQKQVLK